MQASQAKEYFPDVKKSIDNATQLCQISKDVPDDVRDRLSELGRESEQVKQVVEQATSDEHIHQSVVRLEKLGDRALHVCAHAGNLDPQVQSAVRDAHDAISRLKHRLLH
jgi:Icc-related predicted phosphoesterase